MKKIVTLFLILLPLICVAADELEEKIYIEPTQIGFSTKAIYVRLGEKWETISAVHADEVGLYIIKSRPALPWKCIVCYTINDGKQVTCTTEGCIGKRPPRYPRPSIPPKKPHFE